MPYPGRNKVESNRCWKLVLTSLVKRADEVEYVVTKGMRLPSTGGQTSLKLGLGSRLKVGLGLG